MQSKTPGRRSVTFQFNISFKQKFINIITSEWDVLWTHGTITLFTVSQEAKHTNGHGGGGRGGTKGGEGETEYSDRRPENNPWMSSR